MADINTPASDDVKNVDLTKVHNLSGPVAVEGAEPGDCLVVDILESEFSSGPFDDELQLTNFQSSHSIRCLGDILYELSWSWLSAL